MSAAMMKDIFHAISNGAPLFSGLQITGPGKLGNVLDRRDLDDPSGDLIGFFLHVDAVAAADADNFIDVVIWEADEKDDATTLTAGAKAEEADILGYTRDGVRSVIANPDFDATATATTVSEPKFLQDGTFPRINDLAPVGTVLWFAYRGHKDVIQLFAEETLTADVTLTAFPVFGSMRTRNLVNPRPTPAA